MTAGMTWVERPLSITAALSYNVYTYLDGELMDIEHLCCMDHFWAKAKKALNQGCKKAQFFVTEVGKPSAARTCSLATNGTQEPASDDYRVKTALINHYI